MEPYALIVDDNPSDSLIVSTLVAQEGFVTKTAKNGFDAVDCLFDEEDDASFAVIVVDLHMPFMGGYELIKKIRLNKKYKQTPILVLSARSDSADVAKALAVGANDYLVKPVDPQLFKERFNSLKGTEIGWTEYQPMPESKYGNISVTQNYTLIGLSEVGASIKMPFQPEEEDVVSVFSPLFQMQECPPILARVKNVKADQGGFVCKLTFLGTTKEIQKKLRLMCRVLWNEKNEVNYKNKNDTEQTQQETGKNT